MEHIINDTWGKEWQTDLQASGICQLVGEYAGDDRIKELEYKYYKGQREQLRIVLLEMLKDYQFTHMLTDELYISDLIDRQTYVIEANGWRITCERKADKTLLLVLSDQDTIDNKYGTSFRLFKALIRENDHEIFSKMRE